MKPKYYPHITALGAATLVAAPLCFVIALPALRNDGAHSISEAQVAASPTAIEPSSEIADPSAAEEPDRFVPAAKSSGTTTLATEKSDTTQPSTASGAMAGIRESLFNTPSPNSPSRNQETRVAMLSGEAGAAPANVRLTPPQSESPPNDVAVDDTAAVRKMTMIPEVTIPVPGTAAVPPPVEVEPAVATANATDMSTERESYAPVRAPTYFDATGHLSMAGVAGEGRVNEAASTHREKTKNNNDFAGGMGGSPTVSGWPLSEAETDTAVPPKIVDVILQQPLESRRVNKVENVIAVCREAGWPIALVKSDLPDDYWWVQQMVGIRGNTFAARVNFGNADSISGSVYHMVFVFLDSPDEVRRFRIAKQFKKLPEGIRRSREFTFVRR